MNSTRFITGLVAIAMLLVSVTAQPQDECDGKVSARLRVDTGNPWRPPFGLDRVGAPQVAHVELDAEGELTREYFLVARRDGREAERHPVTLATNPTGGVWGKVPEGVAVRFGHVSLGEIPDEVALIARCAKDGQVVEVTRQVVEWPSIEADARASPDRRINPVDLGAILVRHDTLMLAGGQRAEIEIAAMSRTTGYPGARVKAWFEGQSPVESGLSLSLGHRAVKELDLAQTSDSERTILHVVILDGDRELWRKDIPTMIVANPPAVPSFGAVETKLRWDAPITVKDKLTDYNAAWDPDLKDVVVFLPNGSRFVFWRLFHYAPFWAGPENTVLNYEWAENLTHPFEAPGWGTLYPEPLFDHELRFSRVRIVEATPSRIHVRWTYEGTDLQYRRWGEQVSEDFYFYPDGFGTRVMTLSSEPDAAYEVSEFIILTPPGAYPLEILPEKMIEMLYVDGEKRDIEFPVLEKDWKRYGNTHLVIPGLRDVPAIYRIFHHEDDPAPAIFFSPRHAPKTAYVYQHGYEQGEIATRALGGRGVSGPGFTSVWTAIKDLPEPIYRATFPMLDALGQSREFMIRRWAWLIAKTEAPDAELLEWAASYSAPPALELSGARVDLPSYAQERRAIRLIADSPSIEVKVKPATHCVNPVFELAGAPRELAGVTMDCEPLTAGDFAWDGSTLWVRARIDAKGATIGLRFGDEG